MGTLNAIYVRASDPRTAAALAAEQRAARTERGTDFFAIVQPDDQFRCPEGELADLSARLDTDVIWLGFQSVVDAFQFHHWRRGEHVRSLVYGCFEEERTWERVEGIPEPWERKALFDPGRLEIAMKYTDDAGERRELEQIYRDADLAPDRIEPSIDARECAWRVAEHYRFPGWSVGDEDPG